MPGLRDPLVTYRLTRRDRALLGRGLARLALLMLEAGATDVYPSFRGAPVVRRRSDLAAMQARFADLPGERDDGPPVLDRAVRRGTPFGRRQLRPRRGTTQRAGQRRLAAADAPGVNPQGSVMAIAIRNARRFIETTKPGQLMALEPPDTTIVTGAAGWLGRALLDHLRRPEGPYARPGAVRALVRTAAEAAELAALPGVDPVVGDIRRPDLLAPLFADLDGTRRRDPHRRRHPPGGVSTTSPRSTSGARPT